MTSAMKVVLIFLDGKCKLQKGAKEQNIKTKKLSLIF
jgi:hypothetical protein